MTVITEKDYLSKKYDDGHEHKWFSAFGDPEKCCFCGIFKRVDDDIKQRKSKQENREND